MYVYIYIYIYVVVIIVIVIIHIIAGRPPAAAGPGAARRGPRGARCYYCC